MTDPAGSAARLREAAWAVVEREHDNREPCSDDGCAINGLIAALAATSPATGLDVHINDGSAHDRAMAWSEGHTAGYDEALRAVHPNVAAPAPATALEVIETTAWQLVDIDGVHWFRASDVRIALASAPCGCTCHRLEAE